MEPLKPFFNCPLSRLFHPIFSTKKRKRNSAKWIGHLIFTTGSIIDSWLTAQSEKGENTFA